MNRDPQPENRDPEPKHGNPEEKATVYTLKCERCEQPFRTLNPRTRRCPACELTLRAR